MAAVLSYDGTIDPDSLQSRAPPLAATGGVSRSLYSVFRCAHNGHYSGHQRGSTRLTVGPWCLFMCPLSTNGGPTGHLPSQVRRSVTNMLHNRQHKGRSLEFTPDVRRTIIVEHLGDVGLSVDAAFCVLCR